VKPNSITLKEMESNGCGSRRVNDYISLIAKFRSDKIYLKIWKVMKFIPNLEVIIGV